VIDRRAQVPMLGSPPWPRERTLAPGRNPQGAAEIRAEMGVCGKGAPLELEPRGGVGWAPLTNTSPSNFESNLDPGGLL